MDRSGFINRTYINAVASCGMDDCACGEIIKTDEKPVQQKTMALSLAALSVLAFLCASLFLQLKNYAGATATIANVKRENSIACGHINAFGYIDERKMNNERQRGNNDGNRCPHQWGAASCACINEPKRKTKYNC